jgi:hypothetical protein
MLQEGSCLTRRLERLALYKRCSLLRTFVNYGRKKFYKVGPWSCCSCCGDVCTIDHQTFFFVTEVVAK